VVGRTEEEFHSVHIMSVFMSNIEFFADELRLAVWFKISDGFLLRVRIGEIDIVPLLMEVVGNFHGFVDIVVLSIDIVGSELDLHTIGFPWPLEDGQGSVSGVLESTVVSIFR
jgi:hypothetical protein